VALDRNAPSLWNAAHERWYGWDGGADSIWSQAIRPLLDPREMAGSAAHVEAVVAADPDLACRFERAFGRPTTRGDSERTLVDVAKAIGAFVGTLVSGRTAFDEFRDALVAGDRRAAARYPADAQRGLRLFVGPGRCTTCHVGPMFTHGEFGDIGLPFFVRPGQVDPGRHAGIAALRASPFNLLSRHADTADGDVALKTRHVEPQHRNFGEFKVPSLRNIAETALYMHDGQLPTLDAADALRRSAPRPAACRRPADPATAAYRCARARRHGRVPEDAFRSARSRLAGAGGERLRAERSPVHPQYDFGWSSTFSAMNDRIICSVTGAMRVIMTSRSSRSTWYSFA